MQNQPRKLWRKIGLEKNFLQGTSHSDQSKSSLIEDSFIKFQSQSHQDIQNSSFFKGNHHQNQQQMSTDEPVNQKDQFNGPQGAGQSCDTPIERLMSESGIERKYALWQSNYKKDTEKAVQKQQQISLLQNNQEQTKNIAHNLLTNENHQKEKTTIPNNNQTRYNKQQKQINNENKESDICFSKDNQSRQQQIQSQTTQIIYQELLMDGKVDRQMITIRLLGLGNDELGRQKILEENMEIGDLKQDYFKNSTKTFGQSQLNPIKQKRQKQNTFFINSIVEKTNAMKKQFHLFKKQLVLSLGQVRAYFNNIIGEELAQHITQLNEEIEYLYGENEQLMAKIEKTELLNKKLSDQNIILSANLKQSQQKAISNSTQAQQTITALQNKINSLQQKLEDLQQIQTLKQSLTNKIKIVDGENLQFRRRQSLMNDNIKRLELEVTAKEVRIQQLEWELAQVNSKQFIIGQLQLTVAQLKQQNQTITKNFQSQLSSTIQHTQQAVSKATQQLLQKNQQLQEEMFSIKQQQIKFNKTKDQFAYLQAEFVKQKKLLEMQKVQLQKEKNKIQQLRKEIFNLKQDNKELEETVQLLETLLSESLRYSTLQIVNQIEKQFRVQQYQTLFTMFAFVKEEIIHKNNLINQKQEVNNSPKKRQSLIKSQKIFQDSISFRSPQNISDNNNSQSQNTLRNDSSKNLLRRTGYFGELSSSPNKPSLTLRLDDIQKNYACEIPEEEQIQVASFNLKASGDNLTNSKISIKSRDIQHQKPYQYEMQKRPKFITHNRHQSVQIPSSKILDNQKNPKFKVNEQIREDLNIVKLSFQLQRPSLKTQIQKDFSNNSSQDQQTDSYDRKRKINTKQNNDDQNFKYPLTNPNYSFSEHNSNQLNNFKDQKNIFGDQSFLDDEFLYETQSVMSNYLTKHETRNSSKQKGYEAKNTSRISTYQNNMDYSNPKKANYKYESANQKIILFNRTTENNKKQDLNKNYNNGNKNNDRQDIIQKIKQRVKQKLKNSKSKHQPSYRLENQLQLGLREKYTPTKQQQKHISPLTSRISYRQDYVKDNPAKNSLIYSRKDQMNTFNVIPENNILSDFYERHRTVAVAYDSIQSVGQRNKSPSNHSLASRSPSNTRPRSPSNSSSVTPRASHPRDFGIGYQSKINIKHNFTGAMTPRSGFSKSMIERPQFLGISRRTGQTPNKNIQPSYNSKAPTYTGRNYQFGTGSYVKKY